MSIKPLKLKTSQLKKVEKLVKEHYAIYKDPIISVMKSPLNQFEFYSIQMKNFPLTKGLFCAINNDSVFWSNNKDDQKEMLKYLNAGKKKSALDIDQVIFLNNLFGNVSKNMIVSEQNIGPLEKMASRHNVNLTLPKRDFVKDKIHYNYWLFSFAQSAFIEFEVKIGKAGSIQVTQNISKK